MSSWNQSKRMRQGMNEPSHLHSRQEYKYPPEVQPWFGLWSAKQGKVSKWLTYVPSSSSSNPTKQGNPDSAFLAKAVIGIWRPSTQSARLAMHRTVLLDMYCCWVCCSKCVDLVLLVLLVRKERVLLEIAVLADDNIILWQDSTRPKRCTGFPWISTVIVSRLALMSQY